MLERLHKVLARAGVAALRPAEDMIMEGRVTVNGRVVRELGTRVDPDSDTIAVDGRQIEPPVPSAAHRYVAVYKPIGVVSTARDTHDRPTVVGLVPSDARLFPVGRLDLESEGLLLLTDDGELAYRLTHPRFEVEKEYRVLLDRAPSIEDLRRWRDGVELDGDTTMPAWVEVQERGSNGVLVRIVMREGRKRQIREVAKLLGYEVRRLIRVREGTLGLGELVPGQWRELAPDEVEALRAHVRHVPGPPADEQESRVPTRTPSDQDQTDETGGRRPPRRIPPRPGFGARGPTRRVYAENDENDTPAAERRFEPSRADEPRAQSGRPDRQADGPQQRSSDDERPRRPAAERDRAPAESGPPRRSYGRGDDARRDDRSGERPYERRDQAPRGSYGRQADQRGPANRRDEGQRDQNDNRDRAPRGPYNRDQAPREPYNNRDQAPREPYNRDQAPRDPYNNRDQGSRDSYDRRSDGQRGPYGRSDDGQRGPSGRSDDRQGRPYNNRGSGPGGARGPSNGRGRSSLDPRAGRSSDSRGRSSLDPRAGRPSDGYRSRSSLDPRAGRPSDGQRSRSSLDPRSGRPSDGQRSRSSLDPRSGRPSDGYRSRSSLDPRARSGEGRDRPYGRSGPPSRSGPGRPGGIRSGIGPSTRGGPGRPSSRPGGIRSGIGPSRGPARPGQRDNRYGSGQRDNRYGSRSSGGPRTGSAGSGANRRPDYDPNRRPSDPNRRSDPPRSNDGGRGTTDNPRRSPGPRPNRRPREEENE